MIASDFSARQVALDVLGHLERRRQGIVEDAAAVEREVEQALEPVRRAYGDLELPASYLAALEREVRGAVPARWRELALPYTRLERRGFGVWRGGDPLARIVHVAAGFLLGLVLVRAPFIPVWERWIPWALAIAAYWLPDLQVRAARRSYLRRLAEIAADLASAQPALDRHVTVGELLPPGER